MTIQSLTKSIGPILVEFGTLNKVILLDKERSY
jgi:hypothetical protein